MICGTLISLKLRNVGESGRNIPNNLRWSVSTAADLKKQFK